MRNEPKSNNDEYKDPEVWDPPTPKVVEKKKVSNWGA